MGRPATSPQWAAEATDRTTLWPIAKTGAMYLADLIQRRPPYETTGAVELATLQWVHWLITPGCSLLLGASVRQTAEAHYSRLLVSGAAELASV